MAPAIRNITRTPIPGRLAGLVVGAGWLTALDDSTDNRKRMNPMQWVQELQGPALIAVICGLLFLEEVGVPLFFAPGDLVLAISGIAIAGGRVNATALVVAAG